MATELSASSIEKISGQIEKLVVDRMDKIAVTAHNLISIRTPADTGQARAGWNFTLNSPDTKVPSRPAKDDQTLPAQSSKPDSQAKKITDSYFLVNAVHHIVYLNEGSSQQAPSKFVESELSKAVDLVGGAEN